MSPKSVQDCPDHFVAFVIVKSFVSLDIRRNNDRNDDVAIFFTRCFSHDTTNRLNNIDL